MGEPLKGRRVSELLNIHGGWDEDLIRRHFVASDVVDILSIPLGRAEEKDEIVWNLDSKGRFSVKSAYHLATKIQEIGKASGSCEESQVRWRNLWKLKDNPEGENMPLENYQKPYPIQVKPPK